MNYPAASCGVSENLYDNSPDFVTPECFYRGSSSGFAWISAEVRQRTDQPRAETDPSEAMWRTRLKRAGMTDLGLLIYLTQQAAENEPVEIQ
jgi:hypothetical protein